MEHLLGVSVFWLFYRTDMSTSFLSDKSRFK